MKVILRDQEELRKTSLLKLEILVFALMILNCSAGLWEKGGHTRNFSITPQATIVRGSNYKILETSQGESSTLFLFGLFPVTPTLDMEYAMSQAVQKVPNGQSMIDIAYWHETNIFFPIGTVSVLKVEGKVIRFDSEPTAQPPAPKRR